MNHTHVTPQIPRCATKLALHGLRSIVKDDPQRFASGQTALDFLKTDRSRVFNIVMAERCATGERAVDGNSRGSEAPGPPGGSHMSS